jgi:hypothetical protein
VIAQLFAEVSKYAMPEGLSAREKHAYRLGLLDYILGAIDEGELEAPAEMILNVLEVEREFRRTQLALEISSGPAEFETADLWRITPEDAMTILEDNAQSRGK